MKKIYDFTVKSEKTLRIIVMEVENESETVVENLEEMPQGQASCPFLSSQPDIRLKEEKGIKINFIRIIYALCHLGFFVDSQGRKLTLTKVFHAFGQLLGIDLSHYSNDLSQSKEKLINMNTQTSIFRKMEEIIQKHWTIS